MQQGGNGGPDPFTMLMFMQMQQNSQLNSELAALRQQVERLKYDQLNQQVDMLKAMVFSQRGPARGSTTASPSKKK